MAEANWWESYPTVTSSPPPAVPPTKDDLPATSESWWNSYPTVTELRSTDQKPMPVLDDPAKGAGFLTTMRASLAPDENDQIKRFAASRFPDMPIENAVKRYGILKSGEIVYADPQTGQLIKEVPTIGEGSGVLDTLERTGRQVASGVGPSLPAVGATAAGVAMGPTGMSIPAAGGAAGATDIMRQMLDRALAGEDITKLDLWNSLGHAAQNAFAQALGVLGVKIFERNPLGVGAADRAAAMDPAKRAEWEALQQDARAKGINLSVGQTTGLPSLMQQERQLGRHPATADIMAAFRENQRVNEVIPAIQSQLDDIAPIPAMTDEAVGQFRAAADAIIKQARQNRTNAAAPLYEMAYTSGVKPDVKPVIFKLTSMVNQDLAPNSIAAKLLNNIKGDLLEESLANPGTMAPIDNYRRLHSAKMNIDSHIAQLMKDTGDRNAVGEAQRMVIPIKRELTNILRQAHPGYEAGYQEYLAHTPAVQALQKGGVGVIKKMNQLDRTQLLEAVFNAQRMAPEEVARVRDAYFRFGHGDEWNTATRTWLSSKLADAMEIGSTNVTGQMPNVAARFQAKTWGHPDQKRTIAAALNDPQAVAGWKRFMEILDGAKRSLPEGSPTATDMAANDPTKSVPGAAKFLGSILSSETYLNIGNKLADAYGRMRDPAARIQLADAMLSPDGLQKLRKLRMLPPKGEKSLAAAVQLLTDAGLVSAENQMGRKPKEKPVADTSVLATP